MRLASGPSVELDPETLRVVEPALIRFAMRAVRREDLARDLVQETLLAALESRARFEGRSTLKTWLTGILARKIADHFRKHRREVLADEPPQPAVPSALAPTRRPDAHGQLEEAEAMRVLEAAIGTLSAKERLAVLLCDVEQLDRDEACQSMGVERTHLRVLLHRGRHKLRLALEAAELGRPSS